MLTLRSSRHQRRECRLRSGWWPCPAGGMGTWGHEPRHKTAAPWPSKRREIPHGWGNLPDDKLPEPWSCDWAQWTKMNFWNKLPAENWSNQRADWEGCLGVTGLTPVMFKTWPGPYTQSSLQAGRII
ncbi:hypothetical protein B0H17DRAFT_1138373 [Mycena rosella]|uniref:Uncharacterized protein n=1 Tax=Mycena rosella TaxID=1033263 RepID=A0AAD7D6Q0_MYCRO|nr:hypothetical protein B0H17DRAFT_1138373 [Mycena rosella]